MKKIILLLVFIIAVFFVLDIKTTKANDQIAPCKYVLDLANEKCCVEGSNCCGPFNC